MISRYTPIFCAGLLGLTACGTPTTREQATGQIDRLNTESQQAVQAVEQRVQAPLPLVQRVDRPFVGNKSAVLARENALPPVLRGDFKVAMIFDDGARANALGDVQLPIAVFAERLTRTTGVPTRVKPDVYLPLSQLVPGRAQAAVQAQAGVTSSVGQPTTVAARPPAAAIGATESVMVSIPARLVAPIPQVLDLISVRLGINSRYTEDGYLEFYRLATETFSVAAQPGDITFSSQLGQTAQGGTNFSAASNVSTTTSSKVFAATVDSVRALLTPVGTVVGNDATRQITVTDTAEVLQSVRRLMTDTNRLLSSQIALSIQIVTCTKTQTSDVNIDWFALYTAVAEKYGYTISLRGPTPKILDNGAVYSVTATPGSSGQSRWDGSSVFLRALAEAGNTCSERRQTLYTSNGRPVAYAITRQFDYVSSTTSTTSGVNAVATGINTKTQTVGRILSVLPVTIGEGAMSIDLSINESVLLALRPQSSGTGNAQQTVQLPDILANQSRHTVVMRDGELVIIAGIQGEQNSTTRRALGDNVSPVFGGGVGGEVNGDRLYIVVTARLVPLS